MTEKTINHFMYLKFTSDFWKLTAEKRSQFFIDLAGDFEKETSSFSSTISKGEGVLCTYFYQVTPIIAGADFLVWNAAPLTDNQDENRFFEMIGRVVSPRRHLLEPSAALWGYTRPSVYSRGSNPQEIDPFASQRQTYLVLYPFVKTVQWYLLGKDTRQGMMNEHIRIGRQYPEIKQLLLYSFGVQDQEFIVVYETETLYRFSELVNELRSSDAREYTERDTPVYSAVWRSPQALADMFGAGQVAG